MDMPLICKTMNVKENHHLYTRLCTKIRFEAELRETRHVLSIYSCFEIGCLTIGEKLTRQCGKLLWVIVVFTVT